MSEPEDNTPPQKTSNNPSNSDIFSKPLENDPFENKQAPKTKQKTRTLRKKLDGTLLVSDLGFPKLLKSAINLQFAGKGNEEQDLKKLLTFIHLWAHELKPDLTFSDSISKIEKLCHEKNVKVSCFNLINALGYLDSVINEQRRSMMGIDEPEQLDDENLFDSDHSDDNIILNMTDRIQQDVQTRSHDDGDVLGIFN